MWWGKKKIRSLTKGSGLEDQTPLTETLVGYGRRGWMEKNRDLMN
jgi:hypothetical protein